MNLVALQLGVLLGRREHDRPCPACRPSRPSCGTPPACGRTARGASARRTRRSAASLSQRMTLYRGTSRFLRFGLLLRLGTIVRLSCSATTGSSESMDPCMSACRAEATSSDMPLSCGSYAAVVKPLPDALYCTPIGPARKHAAPWTASTPTFESHRQAFEDDLADAAAHSQRQRRFAPARPNVRRAADWVADAVQAARPGDRADRNGRPSARLRRVAAGARASRSRWSTATTTCSRPSRSTSGSARRSSRRSATATSTPAARPTTKARC